MSATCRLAGTLIPLVLVAGCASPPAAPEEAPSGRERELLAVYRDFALAWPFDEYYGRFIDVDAAKGDDEDRLFLKKLRSLPEVTQEEIFQRAERHRAGNEQGSLGIAMTPSTREDSPGVAVFQVIPGSAAEKAGLKIGDVIVEAEGQPVEDPAQLLGILSGRKAGQQFEFRVVRAAGGELADSMTVAVTLGRRVTPSAGDPLGVALRRVPFDPLPPFVPAAEAPAPERLARAAGAGIDFLLSLQASDGSWSFDPILQVATEERREEFSLLQGSAISECTPWLMTSLAGMALRSCRDFAGVRGARMDEAADRALAFVLDAPTGAIKGGVYRHLVADFLCSEHDRAASEAMRTRIREKVAELVELLLQHRIPGAGWGYGRMSASFITSPVLLTLHGAAAIGVPVPGRALREGADALESMRLKGPAKGRPGWYPGEESREWYMYVVGNQADVSSRLRGGGGRIPMCELALVRGGRRGADPLAQGLSVFLDVRDELDRARTNRGIHTGPYANASYYFLYDYWYAARAASALDPGPGSRGAIRAKVRATLQDVLLQFQREDGTWSDHPAFGTLVGTSMALMTLGETTESSH